MTTSDYGTIDNFIGCAEMPSDMQYDAKAALERIAAKLAAANQRIAELEAWQPVAPGKYKLAGAELHVDGICWLGGFRLLDDELEELARLDTAGQMGAREFVEFFRATYGLPFDGELIIW